MDDPTGGERVRKVGSGSTTGWSHDDHATRAIPDRLTQLERVGSGGTGVVFKAFDSAIHRLVAVKVAHQRLSIDGRWRFEHEARILAQLDHPNIVPVYELFADAVGRCVGFSMKLVDGTTLGNLIGEPPPGDGDRLATLLDVLLRVCDAVEFAHNRGVIHRDLNPQNVMVGAHRQVYVMDWGLALDESQERHDVPTDVPHDWCFSSGTPAYMAPEQALGERGAIDFRTDVFGLGAILYEILTGRPPYVGARMLEVVASAGEASIPQPEEINAQLPAELCRIAMKALSRDRANRYARAADFAADLTNFLRAGGWFPRATFRTGDVIVHQGDCDDVAYMIVAGSCEIYRVADGARVVLRTIGPGGVFGEVALMTGAPRTANVRALTDVTVLVVNKPALLAELSRAPWLKPFVSAISERFLELDAVNPRGTVGAS